MADIFNVNKYSDDYKPSVADKSSNTLFGQTQIGNQVMVSAPNQGMPSQQLLYVTTSSVTTAGRTVDMSMLSRNSTVMACVGVKARALSQLPIRVMYTDENGKKIDAVSSDKVGNRDKARAKQVLNLLQSPNHFQSQYEFWYQTSMWLDLAGETFTLWWRKNQEDPTQTPLEMYNLDATLITSRLTEARYPAYQLSTSAYGFSKEQPLHAYQVMHLMEQSWQGSAGFNKGILATELVGLDQDIDLYANFVMQNGAKPSGMFMTEQVIPNTKYNEIAARLKEAWASMTGSKQTDLSKPGQSILLDQGMRYEKVDMLTLQDADAAKLKEQTMKRICGLFGVPPAMIGIADQKYNNTQTMLDEFYKSTMSPLIVNIESKLKSQLLRGYPNLSISFDTRDFLKGAPIDQMNYVNSAVSGGIMTPNEARSYIGIGEIDGGDELQKKTAPAEPLPGSSKQDTGGGGGSPSPKMAIGDDK